MTSSLTIIEKNGNFWTDSREVAAMVDKQHKDLLRDIRGYIAAMERTDASKAEAVNERNFAPVDFFIESTYTDEKGETRPCFLLSKKGYEFIANKLTGQKGVIFTAAYVSQFNAMEREIKLEQFAEPYHYPAKSTSAGEVASLITATDRPMVAQRSPGWKRAAQTELTLKHFGIPVIDDFVEKPPMQLTFETTTVTTTLRLPERPAANILPDSCLSRIPQ